MSFREKAQIVVLTAALTVASALGLGSFFYRQLLSDFQNAVLEAIKSTKGGDTDDAPIIMAGGSVFIGTDSNGTFKRAEKGNRKILKFDDGFKVFQIDLIDKNDDMTTIPTTDLVGVTGEIVTEYCKLDAQNNCMSGQKDTLTLSFDNPNGLISLKNDNGKQIGKARRVLPALTLWRHKIEDFVMLNMTVKIDGTPKASAKCGKAGDCELVVHTCKNFTNCTAK